MTVITTAPANTNREQLKRYAVSIIAKVLKEIDDHRSDPEEVVHAVVKAVNEVIPAGASRLLERRIWDVAQCILDKVFPNGDHLEYWEQLAG